MSFPRPVSDQVDYPEQPPAAGPDDLRRIFRRHAAAVAVVTTSWLGQPVGLLVTSLASVSADPPLISFNVARTSSSWPALEEAAHVGVHVLDSQQESLANRFARKGADRFSAPTSWRAGVHGIPVLDGVAAWAVATVEHRFDAGNHVIVVARLLQADAQDESRPLVHHDGEYGQVTSTQVRSGAEPVPSRLTVIRTESDRR
jgi:flavin reductase (DIM6/NTAB) family NADH-FMN oxidoreductase RutF